MALRVLIADDEPAARERLRYFLSMETDVIIVAECCDGQSAVSAIREHEPDLIFLDVRMPTLTGFDVVRVFAANVPPVIFVSAHHDHAVDAFDFQPVDYLLKPFDRERFRKALKAGREAVARKTPSRIKNSLAELDRPADVEANNGRLAARSAGKITLLIFAEIAWIEGARNYVEVHVGTKTHLLRRTLSSIEKQLPTQFVRISKSHIINLNLVRELKAKSHGDLIATLLDGTELVVTRSYRDALRKKLNL
ncbi:MAG TPA: LytTR family DNA-binding domain-containing protein [Verrucomicrobiae bacterium]